jgi:group I intron endonuclease
LIGIYKITSPSGKINIGQSWDINKRKYKYETLRCQNQRHLYHSLLKYGWKNHKFEIIHEFPEDITQSVLDNYEIVYWEMYKNCGIEMLNIKEPGRGGKHSEESKKRMSIAGKGRIVSFETRNKIRIGNTGKNKSKEHRRKISEARKGKSQNEDQKKNAALSRLKPILQYSLKGELLKEWDSTKTASSELNIPKTTIRGILIGKIKNPTTYIWKFKI